MLLQASSIYACHRSGTQRYEIQDIRYDCPAAYLSVLFAIFYQKSPDIHLYLAVQQGTLIILSYYEGHLIICACRYFENKQDPQWSSVKELSPWGCEVTLKHHIIKNYGEYVQTPLSFIVS